MNKDKIFNSISKWTWVIEHYTYRYIITFIIDRLKLNINPNIITAIWLLYNIIAWVLILNWYIVVGTVLYFFFPIIDMIDWAIARLYNRGSKFGAFFDGFVDFISEIWILLSVWIYFDQINLFTILILVILIINYISIRQKWIYQDTERQLNFLEIKKDKIIDKLKYTIIIFTRNDTRKLFLIIFSVLWYWELIIIYFVTIYILALINNILSMINYKWVKK